MKFKLEEFQRINCSIEEGENSVVLTCDKSGGRLQISGEPLKLGGLDWRQAKYLVVEVLNHEEVIMGVCFGFWKKGNESEIQDMQITMGLIPGVRTVLCLPLSVLDGQSLFLERTPGKLKSLVLGNKLDLNEVNRFSIGTMKAYKNQKLKIFRCYLSDKEPEYTLPDMQLVDDLGQNMLRQWEGKTKDQEELKSYLKQESESSSYVSYFDFWSKFGGWKGRRFEATGYFRTQWDGKRWWLVDPEGYVFYSTGVDCVSPGENCRTTDIEKFFSWLPPKEGIYKEAWSTQRGKWQGEYVNFAVANLIKVFGQEWWNNWRDITIKRMAKWGFNTIGNWSSDRFIKEADIPYVYPLKDFPDTREKVFRDFPDVFSDEYKKNSKKFAEQLVDFEEDPYLIGYFLRNEPQWAFIDGLNIAEELLENEKPLASKKYLIEFLVKRYEGDVCKFNKAWNLNVAGFEKLNNCIRRAASLSESSKKDLKDFSKLMIERYVKLPSQECKKLDPHHLNLGMRYAFISDESLLSGSENFDVFSINCYKMNPIMEIEQVGKLLNMPVIIGEYHFGALDRGLTSTGLRGVVSQEERGKAYKYYNENAAQTKWCVGTHYFILNDQALLGRFDGENMQIGCVDVCHKPYAEFVKLIRDTNRTIYQVAEGLKEKYNVHPEEIERVGF
jgi:hypothetical protein